MIASERINSQLSLSYEKAITSVDHGGLTPLRHSVHSMGWPLVLFKIRMLSKSVGCLLSVVCCWGGGGWRWEVNIQLPSICCLLSLGGGGGKITSVLYFRSKHTTCQVCVVSGGDEETLYTFTLSIILRSLCPQSPCIAWVCL